jgi:hypothetical protein
MAGQARLRGAVQLVAPEQPGERLVHLLRRILGVPCANAAAHDLSERTVAFYSTRMVPSSQVRSNLSLFPVLGTISIETLSPARQEVSPR